MKSDYTSEELSHFVGHGDPRNRESNYQTLLKVLRSGWVSHPPHDASPGSVSHRVDLTRHLVDGSLIVPTVTCFCDIPLNKLSLHARKYGLFGVSFRRELLVKYGARPVIYVPFSKTDWGSPYGTVLLQDIENVYRSFRSHLVEQNQHHLSRSRSVGRELATSEATIGALKGTLERDFLAFIKPFNADLPDDDPENYYLEREWRKHGNMPVTSSTVSRVFVASGFEGRLRRDFPDFADRVLSLPTDQPNG